MSFRERNSLNPNSLHTEYPEQANDSNEADNGSACSSKRIREDSSEVAPQMQGNSTHVVSYRDKLARVIPGAFEEAFRIEDAYEDDTNDDVDPGEEDGAPRMLLTRDEKLQNPCSMAYVPDC